MMTTAQISNLRPEVWNNLRAYQRVEGLQALEDQLAASEKRTPATVKVFHNTDRGYYDSENNVIGVNFNLVNDETDVAPYQATETMFHEARHAYQHRQIQDPQSQEDPQTVENWRMNNYPEVYEGDGKNNPELYSMQPVELDARQTARQRTDAFFEDNGGHSPEYQKYAETKNQENQEWIDHAKTIWRTENPEQIGVNMISERYSQARSLDQDLQMQSGKDQEEGQIPEHAATQEINGSIIESPGSQISPGPEEKAEGEDYTYGFGY